MRIMVTGSVKNTCSILINHQKLMLEITEKDEESKTEELTTYI